MPVLASRGLRSGHHIGAIDITENRSQDSARFSCSGISVHITTLTFSSKAGVLTRPTICGVKSKLRSNEMAAKKRQEVVVYVPDMGLSKEQLTSMKKSFKSQFVSSLGEKMAAIVIIIVRIKVVRQVAEF